MTTINTKQYINKRILATIIDYAIIFGLTYLYIVSFGSQTEDGSYVVSGAPALVPIIFWFIYIVIIEYFFNGTIGHMFFDLKVVSVEGSTITFIQILKRRFSDALEIVWCFGLIAFILVKNTQYNQRLGDIWAKTLIIGKNESNKKVKFEFEQPS